jgi:multiple sugar transport system permease protein
MAGLMLVPLLLTIWMSLNRMTFRGDLLFNGLANYQDVLEDGDFWTALWFTLIVCGVTIPAKLAIGFLVALALNRTAPRVRGFFVACVLLPFIVTPVVGTLAFSWLFRDFGVVTYWLSLIGIKIYWLSSELTARTLVVLHFIWAGAPFAIIVLFAGLQAVPKDELEAAVMDGASRWYRVRHIVIPHCRSLFVFLGLMMTMDAYRIFDSIAVMTKGVNGTESVMYYNYRVAIVENSLTRGAAVSILTVIGILILLLPLLRATYLEQRQAR